MHTGERITRVAAELFAEYGFHAASTRMIADGVGINIGTLNYHTGGKEELYRSVVRELHDHEQSLIDSYMEGVDVASLDATALRSLLADLIDDLIELNLNRPEIARLWLRRWLEPEGSSLRVEQCGLPLRDVLVSTLRGAVDRGIISPAGDVRVVCTTLTMGLYSYLAGDPALPNEQVEREPFSEFAAVFLDRLFEST